ncbi:MAG: hypothetical protein M1305_01300 [Candidatus Marsarchaeota archaeon]|nr:hypothetical protein [Candidatus Marsarchaeota archaeon]
MELLGWVGTIWQSRYIEVYICLVSMTVALWMGLYLLRRGAGTLVGLLGACALLLTSLIYVFEALQDIPGITAHQYELLLRAQAPTVPSSIAVWVGLAYLIRNNRRVTNTVKSVWLVIGVVAVSQIVLRTFTNWHYDYANIYPSPFIWQDWWTPSGPGFPTFAVLVLVGLVWSVYNVFRPFYDDVGSIRRIPRIQQFWPLFAGALLFLLSVGYMVVAYAAGIQLPEVLGLAGVTLGIVALGFGVFWHNAFVEEGRDVTTDFLYSLIGMVTIMILYIVLIFSVNGFERLGVGPVVALTVALVITHSLHDAAYRFLDSILERAGLSRWTMGYRSRRDMLLRLQQEEESANDLRERLFTLLNQLCREVSTNRGCVALRDGDGFAVQATYRVPMLPARLASEGLVCERITNIPEPRRCGDLKGMGIAVPLFIRDCEAGVLVLGDKRYDDGEINRILVHAEAMQRAIEAREVIKKIGQLRRKLERLQRQQEPELDNKDGKDLLAACTGAGLDFNNSSEVISAAVGMLENYLEDPYALESNPFLKCSKVKAKMGRSRDRSEAVEILEQEIARTISAMKPSHDQGYDWRRWTYLYRRYIDRYGHDGKRITMEEIAQITGVSRKTLSRHHERAVRDFVLALLDSGSVTATN